MKIEELFHRLIEKGWKPFGREKTLHISIHNGDLMSVYIDWWLMNEDTKSLRELVSKESWLWQFCVENKLVREDDGHITRIINVYKDDDTIADGWWDYHYWLMICSILDDIELKDFLIENIQIWNE